MEGSAMRRVRAVQCALLLACLASAPAAARQEPPPEEESFYTRSLHFTNRGIEFVYSKEQGGVERITGVPAERLGCTAARCHVRTCDTCHRVEADGKASFSVETARAETACARCHSVDKDDPDVHVRKGMKCMDCHSAREIHGDGKAYDTYMMPGVIETRCENCHADLPRTASHTVHAGKVACSACHTLKTVTCLNCHYDTRLAGGKEASIRKEGMLFLVNHDGQVTPANFLTHVSGNRTMISLAPSFAHSITKKGLACEACHASANVLAVKNGTLAPLAWKDGDLSAVEGVIPVVEGMTWNLVFLGREGDRWVPLEKPEPPLVNFAGYSSPLSRDQLARLERPQRSK